ncbi:MAG: asparagine synthase (glutamine-hydrolyzing) [Acidobacteria bacterium]|nr:asparagine synthase (glutamine-hydrolyzing) [Acidobacteriota bacterium]
MCGIAGFIAKDQSEPAEARAERLDRMCASIIYRGPDEQGTTVTGRAALGMRRLSIIDIKTGQQPIFTEDGNLAIVFNGEIYNFQAIRSELVSLGHSFRTNSDTEVIVHAFEEFGEKCLDKLRGMFAFAIWDRRAESLFIARDRIGKKPLFYTFTDKGEFIFGSELKTLFAHGGVEKKIDPAALDAYLSFGYVPEEFCIINKVKKLPPGFFLRYKGGKVETHRYWDLNLTPTDDRPESEWAGLLFEKIREAVEIRLISEVPLGAFLSGGVDSSTVVGMMSRLSPKPVKTFSIGFHEDSFDELKYARIAARHFGTEHHEFIVTPDLFDTISEIVWHFDEPFSDQSALPTYMLSKMARDHVTVVLSGDGGDELFAGYDRYLIDQKRSKYGRIPQFVRWHGLRRLSAALPRGSFGKNFLFNISLGPIERYIDSVSTFNGPGKQLLYTADFRAELNGGGSAGELEFAGFGDAAARVDPLARLLYLDSKTYLPGDILTKVDRMTMANSIEARVPLLDHEVIELAAAIPSRLKINGGTTKYILKKAMKRLVPDEILHREKQGFGVPVGRWINDQLRGRMTDDLLARRTLERGWFERSSIRSLLDEHAAGRRDRSDALWTLWMMELWFRRYIDA